jgi:hypothetical protein
VSFATTGLCPACAHVQRVESQRGSVFWLCRLAQRDPRFAKYPPQPVWACAGFRSEPRPDASAGSSDEPRDGEGESDSAL